MTWLPVLAALLRLLDFVASRVTDEELRQAGQDRLLVQQMGILNERLARASHARASHARASDPGPGGLLDDDGYRRD